MALPDHPFLPRRGVVAVIIACAIGLPGCSFRIGDTTDPWAICVLDWGADSHVEVPVPKRAGSTVRLDEIDVYDVELSYRDSGVVHVTATIRLTGLPDGVEVSSVNAESGST